MQRKNKNETENKRNVNLFIPGSIYAGNVSLLAFYWILIKGIFQEEKKEVNSYGWKIKTWKFSTIEEVEETHKQMTAWIKKWSRKYQIREIFVNNAWAVEYRLLIKI